MTEPTVRVASKDGRKTFFEGTDKDARTYVENNFPRLHVEPGVHYENGPEPDAVLYSEGKEVGHFDGTEWSDQKETVDETPVDDGTADESGKENYNATHTEII